MGEKKIVFYLSDSYGEIKERLLSAFPPLIKGGGIKLLRTAGPYSKDLIVIEQKHLATVRRLKDFLEQAKLFVRPLQKDLLYTSTSTDLEVFK